MSAQGDLPDGAFGVGRFAAQDGTEFPGIVLSGERILDVSSSFATTEEIFDDWDGSLPVLEALAADNAEDAESLADVRPLPPLPAPQVFQAGANFRKHVTDLVVAERYDASEDATEEEIREQTGKMMDERAASGVPYVFCGLHSALTGADDPVVLPNRGEKHDWELELAVVFGKPARKITEGEALDHVAGFMIANDVTTRDFFFREDVGAINVDFIASKNQPTFSPVGPYVLPRKFAGKLDDIRITLSVNGEVRQDETLADMIYGLEKLIAYTSTIAQVNAGDILMCGSPAGNGAHWRQWLQPGDKMEGTITGLGAQHNTIQPEERK